MYNMPAIIFAGGKSSRMGSDKSLLPFGGFPTLSEFQHHKLSTLFPHVYLSAKSNKFDFSCSVIEDTHEESSPLIGLISVFETLDTDEVFVLSVDAPLVDQTIINTLYQASRKNLHSDAIVAQSPNGVQPLCGIYRRSILTVAKKHLDDNNHCLSILLEVSSTSMVHFKDNTPFTNVNTKEEYKKLLIG